MSDVPEMVMKAIKAVGQQGSTITYEDAARAAIAAMRGPNDDMLDAGMNHSSADGLPIVRRAYSAMIDAALTAPANPPRA